MAQYYSSNEMLDAGVAVAGFGKLSPRLKQRRFKSAYGCTPLAASTLWNRLVNAEAPRGTVDKLFWTLMFLRQYPDEGGTQAKFGAHPDTIRVWVWMTIHSLQGLKAAMIKLPAVSDRINWISVDGTDCKIGEPINKRLKDFKVLKETFRHPRHKHKAVFEACAVIVQNNIEVDSPLFTI